MELQGIRKYPGIIIIVIGQSLSCPSVCGTVSAQLINSLSLPLSYWSGREHLLSYIGPHLSIGLSISSIDGHAITRLFIHPSCCSPASTHNTTSSPVQRLARDRTSHKFRQLIGHQVHLSSPLHKDTILTHCTTISHEAPLLSSSAASYAHNLSVYHYWTNRIIQFSLSFSSPRALGCEGALL